MPPALELVDYSQLVRPSTASQTFASPYGWHGDKDENGTDYKAGDGTDGRKVNFHLIWGLTQSSAPPSPPLSWSWDNYELGYDAAGADYEYSYGKLAAYDPYNDALEYEYEHFHASNLWDLDDFYRVSNDHNNAHDYDSSYGDASTAPLESKRLARSSSPPPFWEPIEHTNDDSYSYAPAPMWLEPQWHDAFAAMASDDYAGDEYSYDYKASNHGTDGRKVNFHLMWAEAYEYMYDHNNGHDYDYSYGDDYDDGSEQDDDADLDYSYGRLGAYSPPAWWQYGLGYEDVSTGFAMYDDYPRRRNAGDDYSYDYTDDYTYGMLGAYDPYNDVLEYEYESEARDAGAHPTWEDASDERAYEENQAATYCAVCTA